MGAAESMLYDDASMETQRPVASRRKVGSIESMSYDDASMVTQRPVVTRPRPGEIINGDAMIRRKPQQKPKKSSRRRAPSQVKPIKRMEGLVLGGPKTGKRALLSRLKGVDPFATKQQEKSVNANEKEEVDPSITIQYKPPSESPTWDRIKLRIQYAKSIDNNKNDMKNENTTNAQIDFVVLLISPKNTRKTTQSYLEVVLAMYLDRLEYRKSAGDNDNKEEEKIENDINDNVAKPFCIAILFNFRDLEEGREDEKDTTTSRADLKRLVENTLRSRNVQERKVVVELLETSLLNCYGLDGLHRFIYRTYLQRCQTDIERQLGVVRNQIQLTDDKNQQQQNGDKNNKAKTMAYEEFVREITPKEELPSPQDQQDTESLAEDRRQEEPVARRMNFPRKETPVLRMGRDALEAFLASSSEEEDAKRPAAASRRSRFSNTSDSSSSDDDSDDDFFYDESGNRRHQIQNPKVTISVNRHYNRKEVVVDDENPSTSEDHSKEDTREVSSPPKVSSENLKKLQHQDKKSQTPQQTTIIEVEASIEEKIKDKDRIQNVSKDITRQEGNVTETYADDLEKELVDEEDENETSVSTIESNRNGARIESSTKDFDENGTNCENDGNNKMRRGDDEAHAVVNPDIANNSGSDPDSLNANSVEGSDQKGNDEVDNLNSSIDYAYDGDNAVSEDNNDDIGIPAIPSLSIESDDDGDGYMIDSDPITTKVVEDNDDDDIDDLREVSTVDNGDDDDFMINSTPDVREVSKYDNDDDDEYVIESTFGARDLSKDDSDDEDGDYMIGSTPVVDEALEDDDDSYMINTTSDAKNVAQDDSDDDDDDCIIGSTSVVKNIVENDDDDDDEFMIGHTSVNEDNAVKEEDSDSDFMIQDSNNEMENSSETQLSAHDDKETKEENDESPKVEEASQPATNSSTKPVASRGISQAALAAIAAAQQEAEAMIRQQQQQQYSELPSTTMKEKKSKKKKKDEKKKKKKKKTKSLED